MLLYDETTNTSWAENVRFPNKTPEQVAAHLRKRGEHYGYSECCIVAFVSDVLCGRFPAEERPSALPPSGVGTFVPCPSCEASERAA
jgi:hypothetical protein